VFPGFAKWQKARPIHTLESKTHRRRFRKPLNTAAILQSGPASVNGF
jgi:hypothetical protein